MKKILTITLSLVLATAGYAQIKPADQAKLPVMTKDVKVMPAYLTPDAKPNRGGTVTLRLPASPTSFNMYGVIDNNTNAVLFNVLDPLVEVNPVTKEVEPALATSWKLEGNTITFKLRDIKWSDGEPFTADDVVFTFENYAQNDKAMGNNVSLFGKLEDKKFVWSKVDDRTVKVTMKETYGPIFYSLTFIRIVPQHALASKFVAGDPGSVNKPWTTDVDPATIVGTGPYAVEKYLPDQKVIMKRNPYSYRVDTKGNLLPYADKLEFLVIKDNEVATLKFQVGEIDYIDVAADQFPSLKAKEKNLPISIFRASPTNPTPSLQHISFNLDSKNADLKALFRNKDFRNGVEFALDRAKLIDQVWNGLAILPGAYMLPTNKSWYNPEVAKIQRKFDPAKATAAFDKAGLKAKNSDGWRTFANGKPVEFVLTTSTAKADADTAVILQASLKALGIKCEIQILDANLTGQKFGAGDYDVSLRAFGNQPDPELRRGIYQPTGNLYYWHPSVGSNPTEAKMDEMLPFEKELFDLFQKGAVEIDQAKRKVFYDRMQVIYAEETPLIFVVNGMNLYGANKDLGNYYQDKAGLINYTSYTVYRK